MGSLNEMMGFGTLVMLYLQERGDVLGTSNVCGGWFLRWCCNCGLRPASVVEMGGPRWASGGRGVVGVVCCSVRVVLLRCI